MGAGSGGMDQVFDAAVFLQESASRNAHKRPEDTMGFRLEDLHTPDDVEDSLQRWLSDGQAPKGCAKTVLKKGKGPRVRPQNKRREKEEEQGCCD